MDASPTCIVSLRHVARWVMAARAVARRGIGRALVAVGVATGAIASGSLVLAAAWGCRLHTEGRAPVAEQALAPDFALPAHDGRTVGLAALLADGPAVLVFYRGHW